MIEATIETCTHFWLIPLADGPTGTGVCKLCGEERDFPNSITDFEYGKRSEVGDFHEPFAMPNEYWTMNRGAR